MKNGIPDLMIDRAVELWCRALRRQKFYTGDKSSTGWMSMALCTMLADSERGKVDDFDGAVERFRDILSAKLKFLRDHDGKPRPSEDVQRDREAGRSYPPETYFLDTYLSCDYGPGGLLGKAAEEAGIPDSAFSIKSSVHFSEDHVAAQFGYGRERVNHYPLPDGRWLITTLSGDEMPKVVDYVMGGRPGFEVEELGTETTSLKPGAAA